MNRPVRPAISVPDCHHFKVHTDGTTIIIECMSENGTPMLALCVSDAVLSLSDKLVLSQLKINEAV